MSDALNDQQQAERILGLHSEIDNWDTSIAKSLAAKDGLKLSKEHFDVLAYLRECYQNHGKTLHARSLSQALDVRYATQGGLKYLYSLFPNGPVTQGCKIAGLPIPGGSADASFGSVR